MSTTVTVPFEGKDLSLRLPPHWEVIDTLAPRPLEPVADVRAALREALEAPIGCAPLRGRDLSGKRVVIAVDDVTRPTPLHLLFDEVVRHLCEAGARKEDMLVLAALGVHRDMTDGEMERKLGREALEGIEWKNHRFRDESEHVLLGSTSRGTEVRLNRHLAAADLVLCVGAIEPHLLLGFGGGAKMILPGLAYERTIAQNHMQGVSAARFNYVGVPESPMRLDLEEAVAMLGREVFVVNAVVNERLKICRIVCGDPVAAHREGLSTVARVSGFEVSELADVAVVASSPMNADLRQGMKCIGNVEQSVREDGLVLGLLECERGIGDVAIPPRALPHGALRSTLRLLGRDRVLWLVDKVKRGVGVEERFLAHFSMQVVRKNEVFVYSRRLPHDTGKRLGLVRQFGDVDEMLAAAARRAPRRARVYVFPYGGVTYARPGASA